MLVKWKIKSARPNSGANEQHQQQQKQSIHKIQKKNKAHKYTQIAKKKKRNQSLKTQILLLSLSSPYDTSNNAGLADTVPQYVHRYV